MQYLCDSSESRGPQPPPAEARCRSFTLTRALRKLRPAVYPPYPQRLNDYADFYFALRDPNGTQFALTPHTVFN